MSDERKPAGETTVFSRKNEEIQDRSWTESAAMVTAESNDDSQSMKVAWIGALIFHFLIFVTVFPSMGGSEYVAEVEEAVVIKRYKPPTPPKEQPKKKVIKKSASRVPIPDPTPDEPEPIVAEEIEFVEDLDIPVETEFLVGMPTGGPPVIDTGPMRVGGDIQAPERIFDIAPVYPELARRARMEGFVILQATIDKQGNVKDVETLRGLGLGLEDAAIDAVKQWVYTPTIYNGRPIEVILTVTVDFKLIQ